MKKSTCKGSKEEVCSHQPPSSFGWNSGGGIEGYLCIYGQGNDVGLRIKGLLLSLLALELFGYCTAVVSAIDVVVDNGKIVFLCWHIISYVPPGGFFKMEKILEQDYDVVTFIIPMGYWQIPDVFISFSATCTESWAYLWKLLTVDTRGIR